MRNKNLLLIFGVLLMVNLLFGVLTDKSSRISFNENKFALADTSGIATISIGEVARLSLQADEWILNDGNKADPTLRRLLFSILQRVKVKRPADVAVSEAKLVQITGDDPVSFYVWGNATKTKTYFALQGEDEAYEVHIPGYNEYLGGIFELTADQWRDRLLFSGSWRTIQHLALDYQSSDLQDLDISFNETFFQVSGVAALDSNAVVDYLNQYQYFQVNEWISAGRFELYDSLAKMPAWAELTVESINYSEPMVVDIFPRLAGDKFFLCMTSDNQLFAIDQRRMSQILGQPSDFAFKSE